ncbi:Type IV secretion system protein virB1 [compost metagenome]
MLPGLEMMACTELAVPAEVMRHVVHVESSFNPYAIGVVGGRLARQPKNLGEALSTTRMLEREGYNFSLGIAQVNRYNLAKHGLDSYEKAFGVCPNLQAGSRILAECYSRSKQDWGKAFSCYYSGNFTTGYRHGYVDKVMASWRGSVASAGGTAIPVIRNRAAGAPLPRVQVPTESTASRVLRRIEEAALSGAGVGGAAASAPAPTYSASPAYATPSRYPAYGNAAAPAAAVPGTSRASALQAPGAFRVGVRTADDAPVVVQAMGAPPVSQPEAMPVDTLPASTGGRGASDSTMAPAAAPARDAAFVF